MYQFIFHLHSGWAYVTVLFSLALFAMSLYFFFSKKQVTPFLKKVSFYTVMAFHIQFLVGIVLYIVSPIVETAWKSGEAMKNAELRRIVIEHPFMLFTAVILITIANAKLKKSPMIKASTLIFITLALACFYMIPWSTWIGS